MSSSDTILRRKIQELKEAKANKKPKFPAAHDRLIKETERTIIKNVEAGLSPEEQKTKARQAALRKARRESGEKFQGPHTVPTREEAERKKKKIIKDGKTKFY